MSAWNEALDAAKICIEEFRRQQPAGLTVRSEIETTDDRALKLCEEAERSVERSQREFDASEQYYADASRLRNAKSADTVDGAILGVDVELVLTDSLSALSRATLYAARAASCAGAAALHIGSPSSDTALGVVESTFRVVFDANREYMS